MIEEGPILRRSGPIPDGQSFPGGFLAFTTALLDEPDEATVAAVVAHELAHPERGHLFGDARRGKLVEATYRNLEPLQRRVDDRPDKPFLGFGRTRPFSLDRRRDVLDRLAHLRRLRRRDDLGHSADDLRRLVPRDRD